MVGKIIENIHAYPDRTAFVIDGRVYSYAALGDEIGKVARFFRSSTLETDRIAILCGDGIETYGAILGALLSGRAFVPLSPRMPFERNKAILQASKPTFLVHSDESSAEKLAEFVRAIDSGRLGPPCPAEPAQVSGDREAYVLFTSGSTGKPKGVSISFGNLNAFLDAFFDLGLEISAEDRFLQMFELTFDLSIFSYLVPLLVGAAVVVADHGPMKCFSILEALLNGDVTVALLTPSVIQPVLSFREDTFPALRHSLFCGEPLKEMDLASWRRRCPGADCWNMYGPTEATIFCSAYKVPAAIETLQGVVSIGKPLKGVGMSLEDGELVVSGPQVSAGYLEPEASAGSFRSGADQTNCFRTGDIVSLGESGNHFFHGRNDSQVKIKGFRADLGELQYFASAFSGAPSIAALAPDSEGEKALVLWIEGWNGDLTALLAYLKDHLPEYMIPSRIIRIPRFPRTIHDKVNIQALLREAMRR